MSDNYGYITKFMIQSFPVHPDFIGWSFEMNALEIGTDDITSESGVSIESITTQSVSAPTYTNISITFNNLSILESDVYFQTSGQSFSLVENNIAKITPDLPWSSSGSTSISFSISNYLVSSPSWIIIDSITGTLTITSPDVDADTKFEFYINSAISGVTDSIQKLIKLTILNWSVQNCQKCSSSSSTLCEICYTGFNLISSQWHSQQVPAQDFPSTSSSHNSTSETSQTLKTTSIWVFGATVGVVAVMSLLNTSSMTGLWSMINQLQLFFLLLLTRAYIPDEVKVVIIGSKI